MSTQNDLNILVSWMAGIFSSKEQATANTEYVEVMLTMYPFWQETPGAHWLYVEQALASSRQEPYRQRVYEVSERESGLFESKVYLLPNPEQYIAAWEHPEIFNEDTPTRFIPKSGCSMFIRRVNPDSFAGSTLDKTCESALRGAKYATSQVVIAEKQLLSWDRGFDANGLQVWGATTGGYIFKKSESFTIKNK